MDQVVEEADDTGATVRWEIRGAVAWIVLDRPHVKNALTYAQRERIVRLLERAAEDPVVRAVVLTATGDAFCTGADLRAGRPPVERPASVPDRVVGDVSRGIRTNAQRVVQAILDCDVPVIAGVNGTAAGLGVHLALACDLVVATEGARFIEAFVRRGLVPDGGGAYLLARLVGPHRAKELLFFGDALDASEAERLGFVNKVVPNDRLQETIAAMADRLAEGPTRAIALTKGLVNRAADQGRIAAFADEAMAQDLNMHTADAQEGVDSFVQRRAPVFRGW